MSEPVHHQLGEADGDNCSEHSADRNQNQPFFQKQPAQPTRSKSDSGQQTDRRRPSLDPRAGRSGQSRTSPDRIKKKLKPRNSSLKSLEPAAACTPVYFTG